MSKYNLILLNRGFQEIMETAYYSVCVTNRHTNRHIGRIIMEIKLCDYAENLFVEAKKQYISKLSEIFCKVDPYIDNDFKYSVLSGVTYEQIYDFLVNSIRSSNSKQNAFKSLDTY